MTDSHTPGSSAKPTDDAEFLASLIRQDHHCFKQLVGEYHGMLVHVARAIVGDEIAEEVVQEAWISAFNALPKFEGRSALKTWLYTIVSNQAKSRLRKESKWVRLPNEADAPDPLEQYQFRDNGHWASPVSDWHIDSPDGLLEQSQLQRCIEVTLAALPDQQRAVFYLRDIEQENLSTICNILELSESNTRVLLHRARIKLMQVIDRYQETGTC